jgi:hypothetical protein
MKNIPGGDARQCRIIKRMALSYFEERIQLSIKSASAAQLQMRIASFPDRNLAIALDMIVPADQDRLLAILPTAKAKRVKQEQEYLGRLKMTLSQKRLMAERLADALEGKGDSSGGTWIAPGGKHR